MSKPRKLFGRASRSREQLHPHTFTRSGEEKRTASLHDREEKTLHAGIDGLVVLNTTDSAFENFLRDEYTTLKEDRNRILATAIRAAWTYRTKKLTSIKSGYGVRTSPSWKPLQATTANRYNTRSTRWAKRCSRNSTEFGKFIFRSRTSTTISSICRRLISTIPERFFCRPTNRTA